MNSDRVDRVRGMGYAVVPRRVQPCDRVGPRSPRPGGLGRAPVLALLDRASPVGVLWTFSTVVELLRLLLTMITIPISKTMTPTTSRTQPAVLMLKPRVFTVTANAMIAPTTPITIREDDEPGSRSSVRYAEGTPGPRRIQSCSGGSLRARQCLVSPGRHAAPRSAAPASSRWCPARCRRGSAPRGGLLLLEHRHPHRPAGVAGQLEDAEQVAGTVETEPLHDVPTGVDGFEDSTMGPPNRIPGGSADRCGTGRRPRPVSLASRHTDPAGPAPSCRSATSPAMAVRSATMSASGRLASSSCVQPSLRSGSTLARSSMIIARSDGVFP